MPYPTRRLEDMNQKEISDELENMSRDQGERHVPYTNEVKARLNELRTRLNELQTRNIEPSEVVSSPNYESPKDEALPGSRNGFISLDNRLNYNLEGEFEGALENAITELTGKSSLEDAEKKLKKAQKRLSRLKRRVMHRKTASQGTAIGGGWRKSNRKSTRKSRKPKRKSRRR